MPSSNSPKEEDRFLEVPQAQMEEWRSHQVTRLLLRHLDRLADEMATQLLTSSTSMQWSTTAAYGGACDSYKRLIHELADDRDRSEEPTQPGWLDPRRRKGVQ